ncbi:MAG: cyanophycin synthetase [Patescibacteria group bacterium]
MKIFCSGIGGAGMSAYAAYQASSGHRVSGSDKAESKTLEQLRSQGLSVSLMQDGSALPEDTELFIYTLALADDHPERLRARKLGIPEKSYFEALGDLCRESGKNLIAVCGTHGKSSTTAMAAKVLIEAGRDPSVILGVTTSDLQGRNWRKENGACHAEHVFLVEACEYRRSFLHLSPSIILLTNADGDHMDYFRDLVDYEKAFQEFVALLPKDGVLIAHGQGESVRAMIDFVKRRGVRVIDADIYALPELTIPGVHMRNNAQLALALAGFLGIDEKSARVSLRSYKGSSRRMEIKGKLKMDNGQWTMTNNEEGEGVIVIDDYGHHPKEVVATLEALKEAYPKQRLICVYQPHTHDRTLKFYDDFTKAFRDADLVIIPNIFDARKERDSGTVDLPSFISDIAGESKVEVLDGQSLEKTILFLQKTLLPHDILLTMGAGDVWRIAQQLTVHS